MTSPADELTVDTALVEIQPTTSSSKATIVVDVGIFNDAGVMEVQVEGLAVSAIAQTQPKDDYELYLHTVTDVDPTDTIVQDTSPASYDPALVESCARVATFFVREGCQEATFEMNAYYKQLAESFPSILGTMNADYWRSDTEQSVDRLIQDSHYRVLLDLIRSLSMSQPENILTLLNDLIDETHHLSFFGRHVGRIAKQIAHRYPDMDILSITSPEAEFVTNVLSAIGSSFSSFTDGTGKVRDAEKYTRMVELVNREYRSVPLNFTRSVESQDKDSKRYDLVILSASMLEQGNAPDILKRISSIMTAGGFLIVTQVPTSPIDRLRQLDDQQDISEALTPPEWPDFLDAYDFIHVAKNSDQSYYPGFSVMVRQLSNSQLELIKDPSNVVGGALTDHLLIVGGAENSCHKLSEHLQEFLSPLCRQVSFCTSFADANSSDLDGCTAAIILADLEKPLMANMTQKLLDQLRELLRPGMKILWLTVDSRFGNPDHAATYGFTRTISAEIPGLALQMLDLEKIEGSGDIVADNFIRLMAPSSDLWTAEREIHMEGGLRLIPRIVPLKESNDRVNSMRRVVSSQRNTSQESIEVVPRLISRGLIRYEARDGQPITHHPLPDQHLIRVDYGSVEALKLDTDSQTSNYVCFGISIPTGEPVMAISESNSSYISVPTEQVAFMQLSERVGLSLISLTLRYLVGDIILAKTRNQRIILIDADPILAQYVSETSRVTCYSTSDSARVCTGKHTPLLVHPHASALQIKAMFPAAGAAIFDFQPRGASCLSQKISDLLPANCDYYYRTELLRSRRIYGSFVERERRLKVTWRAAMLKAFKTAVTSQQSHHKFDAVSLPDLQANIMVSTSPFRVLDWRADRNVTCIAKSLPSEQIFREDRTYVLVGLTKDFGQSLCHLLAENGARNIIVASRTPKMEPKWVAELGDAYDANIQVRKCDVTDVESVYALKEDLSRTMPPVAGVINGAMVLDDRVFAQMDEHTWNRVLRPKAVGSRNLDVVFNEPNLEFFIMTSSFAAIGGHPGQSNYAAANMYMNGLAGERRRRGLAGSVLNIGVIYGIGFLQREKEELYIGLEREGYPPISERDIHHMFLEAIVAGRPGDQGCTESFIDFTTGLSRFDPFDLNPLHWHTDPRFSHYTRRFNEDDAGAAAADSWESLADTIKGIADSRAVAEAILDALTVRLESLLRLAKDTISPVSSLSDLGVDSLAAVDVRGWIFKTIGKDVSVIKLLSGVSIEKCELKIPLQKIICPLLCTAQMPPCPGV